MRIPFTAHGVLKSITPQRNACSCLLLAAIAAFLVRDIAGEVPADKAMPGPSPSKYIAGLPGIQLLAFCNWTRKVS